MAYLNKNVIVCLSQIKYDETGLNIKLNLFDVDNCFAPIHNAVIRSNWLYYLMQNLL